MPVAADRGGGAREADPAHGERAQQQNRESGHRGEAKSEALAASQAEEGGKEEECRNAARRGGQSYHIFEQADEV